MYGISAFASQLLVSDSTVCDMTHSHLKAVAVSNEALFGGAVVVAEHLFVYIAEQMEPLHPNVPALQIALQKAPEILKAIGVNLAANVPFRMVNRLVGEVLVIQSLIGQERVGVDGATCFDVSANLRLQVMLAASRNDIGVNLAATLKNP